MIYWFMTRKGLRTESRPPRDRKCVSEVVIRTGDPQHTIHKFTGPGGQTAELDAWCGYDRGPRHHQIVTDMLK